MPDFLPSWHDLGSWSVWMYYVRSALEVGLLYLLLYYVLMAFERISAGGKIRGLSLVLTGAVLGWRPGRLISRCWRCRPIV